MDSQHLVYNAELLCGGGGAGVNGAHTWKYNKKRDGQLSGDYQGVAYYSWEITRNAQLLICGLNTGYLRTNIVTA